VDEIRQDPRPASRLPTARWLDVAAAVSLIAAAAAVLMDRARAARRHMTTTAA
jgi:hypothetical protein